MATIEITASRLIEPYLDKLRPYAVTVPDDLQPGPETQIGARVQVFNDGDADGYAILILGTTGMAKLVTGGESRVTRIPPGGSATLVASMDIAITMAGRKYPVLARVVRANKDGRYRESDVIQKESFTLDVGQSAAERRRLADLRYQEQIAFGEVEDDYVSTDMSTEAYQKMLQEMQKEQAKRQRQEQVRRDMEQARREREQQQKDYQQHLIQQRQQQQQRIARERQQREIEMQRERLASEQQRTQDHVRRLVDADAQKALAIRQQDLIQRTREVLSYTKDAGPPPTIYIGSQQWQEDSWYDDDIDD